MAKKLTKRKAFNFLRSYFDVLNELNNDKDKLDFLLSIINKQFLDEDPKSLNFIVNLCYESQRHSIESSVKGWKRANNIDPTTNPMTDPTTDPMTDPKEEEEKEEEKEEEEVKEEVKEQIKQSFETFWNLYDKKVDRKKSLEKWDKLKQSERDEIIQKTPAYVRANPDPQFRKNPVTFFNNRSWEDEIIKEVTKRKPSVIEQETEKIKKALQYSAGFD